MRAVVMVPQERALLLERLAAMPDFLEATFAALSPAEAATSLADGEFAPVEQAWHLADLEREGYAIRLRRLLDEVEPELPDFDGARVAAERVQQTKQPFRLNPMSSRERRIVHLAVKDIPGVRTQSVGLGEDRQVVIHPADSKPPAP
jgi:hypothetical protein